MKFQAVIDLSSFIWDENDFHIRPNQYYDLASKIPTLLNALQYNQSYILMREELIYEIFKYFPYNKIPYSFYDFERMTFEFLGSLGSRLITFPNNANTNITSNPNLLKNYFSANTLLEVKYLITQIHTKKGIEKVYFTFNFLWGDNSDLSTSLSNQKVIHETVISDKEEDLTAFFSKSKPIFEHNPKHDRNKIVQNVSPLSCFDGIDVSVPQKILDGAIFSAGLYYGYDLQNEVYVIFRNTHLNIFHAYDEMDINSIPNEVRKIFSK